MDEPLKNKEKGVLVTLVCIAAVLILAIIILATPWQLVNFGQLSTPEIELVLVEGPDLDEARDLYRFKVAAQVTGKPSPAITFSRHHIMGGSGADWLEIFLREGERFDLTATAVNKLGQASATIQLRAPGAAAGGGETSVADHQDGKAGDNSLSAAGEDDGNGSLAGLPANHPPAVAGISMPYDEAVCDLEYVFTVTASDPDGDNLAYAWTATGGAITDASVNPMIWKAPDSEGVHTINVKVRDGRGGETSARCVVPVRKIAFEPLPPLPPLIPIQYNALFLPAASETGYIIENEAVMCTHFSVFTGDTFTNKMCRSMISFNITPLAGATIHKARLTFAEPLILGDPGDIGFWFGWLRVESVYWGARAPVLPDYSLPEKWFANYNLTGNDFVINSARGGENPKLVQLIQENIDAGRQRFQIRLRFKFEASDGDGQYTGVDYPLENLQLLVTYSY